MSLECNSLLAKLLAQEDLSIIHDPKLERASFDIKTRVLRIPVYNDMSGDLYDAMIAKEVGYALWTPESFNKVKGKLTDMSEGFDQIIEVIEDARTSKHLKHKYPGLSGIMSKMYMDFWDKDYFGLKSVDLSAINIVDKLNVISKLPWLEVPLNPMEQTFADDLENVSTFRESCVLAIDIAEYIKEERRKAEEAKQQEQEEEQENDGQTDDTAGDESGDSGDLDERDGREDDLPDDDESGRDEPEDQDDDDSDGAGESEDDHDQSESNDSGEGSGSDDSEGNDEDDSQSDDDSRSDGKDPSGECDDDDEVDSSGSGECDSCGGDTHDDDAELSPDGDGTECDGDEDGDGDPQDGAMSDDIDAEMDDFDGSSGDSGEADSSEQQGDDSSTGDDSEDGSDRSDGSSGDDSGSDSMQETDMGGDFSPDDADCSPSEDESSDCPQSDFGSDSDIGGDAAVDESALAPISSQHALSAALVENEVNTRGSDVENVVIPEVLNHKVFVDTPDVVHQRWNAVISQDSKQTATYINNQWIQFQQDEKKTIEHMKQVFNLKKNAEELRRVQTGKSGRLDMKKLAFYKTTEDIFMTTTFVDDGKNHGVALVIDFSASMNGSRMFQVLRQAILMVMFCQSVDIPFVVYGFTNVCLGNYSHMKHKQEKKLAEYKNVPAGVTAASIHDITLREFINSDLPVITQRQILRNMFREAMAHQGRGYGAYSVMRCECTSGTPTNEAMLVLSQVVSEWKIKHDVEIMNTMILTDGASSNLGITAGPKFRGGLSRPFIMNDAITKRKFVHSDYRGFDREPIAKIANKAIFDIYKARTESSLILFYVGQERECKNVLSSYLPPHEIDAGLKSIRTNRCMVSSDYKGVDRLLISVDRDVSHNIEFSSKSMNDIKNQFIKQSHDSKHAKFLADTVLDLISQRLEE